MPAATREEPVFAEPGAATGAWRRARVERAVRRQATATRLPPRSSPCDGEPASRCPARPSPSRTGCACTQAQFGPNRNRDELLDRADLVGAPAGARDVIRLDPGLAFGTGTHPTTRMCLQWLAEHGPPGGRLAARARLRLRLGHPRDRRAPLRRRRGRRGRHRSGSGRGDAGERAANGVEGAPACRTAHRSVRHRRGQHPGRTAEAARAAARRPVDRRAASSCSRASWRARPTSCARLTRLGSTLYVDGPRRRLDP